MTQQYPHTLVTDENNGCGTDEMPRLGAVQMASGPNVQANLLEAGRLIAQVAQQGARVVVLPENFAYMGEDESAVTTIAEQDGEGPIQRFLAEMAREHGVWLVGGTVPVWTDVGDKVRSAVLAFNSNGERVARYDKIHLFDVKLPDAEERYEESLRTEHGDHVEVFDTPCGRIGLAVCYDLRFPELFRAMIAHEVTVIAVPSAFTEITGRAHWEVLVRARAIENLCYVVAAAQGGYHVSGRETHGHSMIVDPWGNILASEARGSAVVTADYDVERLHTIRRSFPALSHRRIACGAFLSQ